MKSKSLSILLMITMLLSACSPKLQADATTETTETITAELLTNETSVESLGSTDNSTEHLDGELEIIEVHNALELMNQLGSNKHFLLMPGDYDMNLYMDENMKSKGTISGLENVILEGVGDEKLDFITEGYNEDVLQIENCKNVTLSNLNIGHKGNVSYCSGAVLTFSGENENITINDCILFGCGTIGIQGEGISGLNCFETTIKDCATDLIVLSHVDGAVFKSCNFINRDDEALCFNDCSGIVIEDCKFEGTVTTYPEVLEDSVDILSASVPSDGLEYRIDHQKSETVELINARIIGNQCLNELEAIHQGLNIILSYDHHPFAGNRIIQCDLVYDSPIGEREYLEQIQKLQSIIEAYYSEEDQPIITVNISWSGNEEVPVVSPHQGQIWLVNKDSNLNMILNNDLQYLTVGEAETILRQWLPTPLSITGQKLTEGNKDIYAFEFIRLEITDGIPYFILKVNGIDDENDKQANVLSVNAVDGSIRSRIEFVWTEATIKPASQKEIDLLVSYWREHQVVIPENSAFWAYIVGEDLMIVLADFAETAYLIRDESGTVTIEETELHSGE